MSFSIGSKKGSKLAFGLKGQQKAQKPAAFAADSDNEEESVPQQDTKRQRRGFTDIPSSAAPSQSQQAAAVEPDPEEKRTADKLADFVAKNGRNFEEVTRQRNPQGGIFKFLFDKESSGYKYYEKRLSELSCPSQPSNFLASVPMPSPPPPMPTPPLPVPAPPQSQASSQQARAQAARQAAESIASKLTAGKPVLSGVPAPAGKSSATPGDSLAAMEAAMKQFAERDEAKAKAEAAEEEAARQPLLNDTSFDRRRVTAVYKDDGSRGHHMGDYIPKEELAKFLAASGTEEAKAQAEALEAASRIQSDNIGHKLLSQMGWKEGQGLGAQGAGLAAPVAANGAFGTEKRGLGAQDHREVQEGDDEFETYRKRMMLGYKHRPNPLGNPRKSYY